MVACFLGLYRQTNEDKRLGRRFENKGIWIYWETKPRIMLTGLPTICRWRFGSRMPLGWKSFEETKRGRFIRQHPGTNSVHCPANKTGRQLLVAFLGPVYIKSDQGLINPRSCRYIQEICFWQVGGQAESLCSHLTSRSRRLWMSSVNNWIERKPASISFQNLTHPRGVWEL